MTQASLPCYQCGVKRNVRLRHADDLKRVNDLARRTCVRCRGYNNHIADPSLAHTMRGRGLTISQIATELHCSSRTVSRYLAEGKRSERGVSNATSGR